MSQELIVKTEFEGLTLYVKPHENYEWLLTTQEVAEGYGVSEIAIRQHKNRNDDELLENIHFISVTNSNGNPRAGIPHIQTLWTKQGVIYLGFFVKSERAKLFRKWASRLILNHIENKTEEYVTVKMLKENNKLLNAMMLDIANALHTLTEKKISNIEKRLELLENHFLSKKQLESPKRIAYVYVLNKVGTNEYKIGKSVEPLKRKNQLEQGGVKLELTLSIKFKTEELALIWENALQASFKSGYLGREWYALNDNQVTFLLELAKAQETLF